MGVRCNYGAPGLESTPSLTGEGENPGCADSRRTLRFVSLLLIIAILCLSMTGCGWRLRGSSMLDVSLPPLQLQFQQGGAELRRELSQSLESSGVSVTDAAELVLVIHRESQGRRVLSVNSSGKVNEYELQYELLFSVRDGEETLVSNQRIRQQRDYQFDEAAVLAKGEEERRLFDFMRRMSIQSLMRRLQSLVSNQTVIPEEVMPEEVMPEVVEPEELIPEAPADAN